MSSTFPSVSGTTTLSSSTSRLLCDLSQHAILCICFFSVIFMGVFIFFFDIITYLPIISAHKKNYYMYLVFLFYLFFSCLGTTKKFTCTAYQTGFLHTCKSHVMMSPHVAPIRKRQSDLPILIQSVGVRRKTARTIHNWFGENDDTKTVFRNVSVFLHLIFFIYRVASINLLFIPESDGLFLIIVVSYNLGNPYGL